MKIAVITHHFYVDLAQEFKEYFQNIPFEFDLFVTTTKGSEKELNKVFFKKIKNLGKLKIIGAPNRGFDIAPFLIEFKKCYQNYDYICKVHGKKSLQSPSLSYWRTYLLNNLLGSENNIREIIKTFENNEDIGIIYPPNYYVVEKSNRRDPWRRNWKNCKLLAEKMGVDLDKNKNIEYPAGSMFWFRPEALKPLFDLDLQYSDFNEEIRSDGTLAHAVERLFNITVNKTEFKEKNILFDLKFNNNISSNKRYNYLSYKFIMLIKKNIIYKLPYSWQVSIFKFFNNKLKQ